MTPETDIHEDDITFKWYVVHTFSGYEERAKAALEARVIQAKQEEHFGEVLVPSEKVIEIRNGKRREITRRHFPGYILVRMNFTRYTYHTVKDTPRVTGFVGGAKKPPSVPDEEIDRLMGRLEKATEAPRAEVEFEKGENVRVMHGPFANFNGMIDEVLEGKQKLRVMVSIFGRATPVELDFTQVEKV